MARSLLVVAALGTVAACASDDVGGDGSTTPPVGADLDGADLDGADLGGADLDGADGASTDSVPRPSSGEVDVGVEPVGFTTVQAVITDADGEQCEVCLWLADSGEERARGLMGVTDLGDAAGMAFVFPEPTTGAFYMFRTPTPLSIAWFAPDGTLVGTDEMAPCLDMPAGDCPLYSADGEYDTAVEVFEGGLETLGIGPGAHLALVDGSEAATCPTADPDV